MRFLPCLLLAAALAAQDEPATIAVVRTWDGLAAQPAIALPGGGTARLGIQATEAAPGEGAMLWCLTEDWTSQEPVEGIGEPFGPFVLAIEEEGAGTRCQPQVAMAERMAKDRRSLYRFLVPARAGRRMIASCRLGVRLVAQAAVAATDQAPHPWTTLEDVADAPEAASSELSGDAVTLPYTVRIDGRPAFPRCDGMFLEPPAGDPAAALPVVPTTPDPGFTLRATASSLVLVSDRPEPGLGPSVLLVRWWVDGAPFVARDPPDDLRKQLDEPLVPVKQVTIPLRLDPALLGVHAGSRIGVQVLRCRDGWARPDERVLELRDPGPDSAPFRLSNRVEFVLP